MRVAAIPGGVYARPRRAPARGLEHAYAAPVKFSPRDTGARGRVFIQQIGVATVAGVLIPPRFMNYVS